MYNLHVGADGGGMVWSDRERLQRPVKHEDSDVPLHRPSKPDSLHAPGGGEKVPGRVAAGRLHAPGDDAQEQSKQSSSAGQHAPVEKTPGGSVPGGTDTSMEGAARAAVEHEATCPNVDRIWFSFGSPVTVYSLPEVRVMRHDFLPVGCGACLCAVAIFSPHRCVCMDWHRLYIVCTMLIPSKW